jgi:hypothetical protein
LSLPASSTSQVNNYEIICSPIFFKSRTIFIT